MKPIRIGNLEYKETASLNSNSTYEEIVLWYSNHCYGNEEQYKKDGWVFDKYGNASKDNCTIHAECFKNPECCYTVAFVEWNNAHDEFDVRSVGTRAFDLNSKDFEDFKELLKQISNSDDKV